MKDLKTTFDDEAEHITAELVGATGGINPDATSIDDIFDSPPHATASQESAPRQEAVALTLPLELHTRTKDLVVRFASALAEKLYRAEEKYGYSDGWIEDDWLDECRDKLNEHVAKGDPRDVAAYCAFLWHHGSYTAAPTATASQESAPGQEAVAWHDPTNRNPGQSVTFDKASRDKWPHLYPVPLYLAPPTSTAIAAMVIKQAAEKCEEWAKTAEHFGFDGDADQYRKLKSEILALTPANAEAELEALMIEATKRGMSYEEANHEAGTGNMHEAATAIVRRVLDEKGE